MSGFVRIAMSMTISLALAACGQADAPPDAQPASPSSPERDGDDSAPSTEAESTPAASFDCVVAQSFPYPDGVPYVGVHAGPGNNDWIPCTTATQFESSWHGLRGFAIAQPNTFSPDGAVTYVTTSQPRPEDCNLHAINVATGEAEWCRSLDTNTLWSAVEVDLDGNLYTTTGQSLRSLDPAGQDRWTAAIPPAPSGEAVGAIGLHFTPDGHIATITDAGTVLLLARADGALLASLHIPDAFGFVTPEQPALQIDVTEVLPEAVINDFQTLEHGDPSVFLNSFAGVGNFSDNTISIAPNGDLYVIGGGPTPTEGAVAQILVDGPPEAPTLSAGWSVTMNGGSATSPAISPDGTQLKFCDGNNSLTVINPETANARARLVDIAACNANTDSEPTEALCGDVHATELLTGPAFGTTPMLDDGVHYIYELQIADLLNTQTPDVRAVQGDKVLWETLLPDDLQWTSVITATQSHLIGTGTRFTDSGETLASLELPGIATSELLVLDRATGALVFRAPVTDDSASTVTVGPDGALYVTMLGLLHMLSLDTRPVGGIMRFAPTN
jgi:outer membrane protein assembly factor BamB